MPIVRRAKSAQVVTALALVASLALAGCGSGDDSAAPATTTTDTAATSATPTERPATTVFVEVNDMTFSPANLTVAPGDTVTWRFSDSAPHSVQGIGDRAMGINSPIIDQGEWSYTFTSPGSYRYLCSLHPEMRGTVTVE